MAAYFQGNPPEISGSSDALLLMNRTTYVRYSDHHHNPQAASHNHLVLLNSQSPPPSATQQSVGIPLSGHDTFADNISTLHGFNPRVHYNLYNPNADNTWETPRSQQGLSLTLCSRQQQQPLGFGSRDKIRVGFSTFTRSGETNGAPSLLSWKYLKAAQELLDEVVNLNNKNGNGTDNNTSDVLSKKTSNGNKVARESSVRAGAGAAAGKKDTAELTASERQEIQKKKSKLISMLDQVDQRYRQYHSQMQTVVLSLEQAAGIGSAKSYTSLALKTISKQFRCLKDAITGQIREANKSLGEEDSSPGGKMEGSRLKFVDHHLRQQSTLQQLGMIQNRTNAWRPQRGLPERAVSVLRAWLFEHFLHPYPKDSDKHMLAKQTGLTRSQVSNWFINARVRLWKPMVEEMYLEETKEQEKNGYLDKTEHNNEDSLSKSTSNQYNSPVTELDGITTQRCPNRHGSNKEIMQSPPSTVQQISIDFRTSKKLDTKILDEEQNRNGRSFMGNHNNFMGSFGQYPIGEITRFDEENFAPSFSGTNGVSLTLGLPRENLQGTHKSFLSRQNVQLGRRFELEEPNDFGFVA